MIFGINYWPEEIGIAPYTTGLAESLAAADWDVKIITGLPHYPAWNVTAGHRHQLRAVDDRNSVSIRRLWHYVPDRQTAARRGGYEATFFLHGLVQLGVRRPDLVLGVVPSLGGGALATLAARFWRVPSAVIFQDLMSNAASQSGITGGRRVARIARRIEQAVVRSADGVAIVSEAFRPAIRRLGVPAEKIVHLRNWCRIPAPTRDRDTVRAELGWSAGDFVVLHAGNMGNKQALENVIDAARIAGATNQSLRFVFMGDGSQRSMLEAQTTELRNLIFLDPKPIAELPDVLAAADALLVNERASVIDMSLPSKLTSYFVAGRPVVAGVAEGATAHEVRRSGAGIVVPAEQPDALLAAFDRLSANPALAVELGAAGAAYAASTLNKDVILRQTERFLIALMNGQRVTEEVPELGVSS